MPRMNRFGLTVILALAIGVPVALAQNNQGQQDGVPRLDHVFVIVLENHNSFTSFGSNGIIVTRRRQTLQHCGISTILRLTIMRSGIRACRIISR